jgi:hypothetical protein
VPVAQVDNSGAFAVGSFQRVAFHLQLDDEFVFASMEAFTDDPSKLGMPTDWVHDRDPVRRLNVVSNSPALAGYAGMTRRVCVDARGF